MVFDRQFPDGNKLLLRTTNTVRQPNCVEGLFFAGERELWRSVVN